MLSKDKLHRQLSIIMSHFLGVRYFKFSDRFRRRAGVAVGVGSPRSCSAAGRGSSISGTLNSLKVHVTIAIRNGNWTREARSMTQSLRVFTRRASLTAKLNFTRRIHHKTPIPRNSSWFIITLVITKSVVSIITVVRRSMLISSLYYLGFTRGSVLLLSRPNFSDKFITNGGQLLQISNINW